MTALDFSEAVTGGDSHRLLMSVTLRGRQRRDMKGQPGDRDRATYEDPKVAARYGRTGELQPPEQTLFDELEPALGRLDMISMISMSGPANSMVLRAGGHSLRHE